MEHQYVTKIINTTLELAASQELSIAVAVTDSHGELLGFARMDNASVQAGLLAQNKAYTSARDRQPSGNLGAWARETGKQLSYWTDPKITGFMGGIPIEKSNRVVGAIGISGLSEEEDEALANQVLDTLTIR